MTTHAEPTYIYPVLGRAGLGNMLFPWARAITYASAEHVTFIPPSWWRPRIGPYLRRELDKRSYHRQLRQPSLASRLESGRTLLSKVWITEGEYLADPIQARGKVVRVIGMENYFEPICSDQKLVSNVFHDLAPARKDTDTGAYVAVHVRLGDYGRPSSSDGIADRHGQNVSTPLTWMLAAVEQVRQQWPTRRIVICSDGSDSELGPLLKVPGVTRSPRSGAVADLHLLASSQLIIGSNSTFSAWASFIGGTPIVFRTGESRYVRGHPFARTWDGNSVFDFDGLYIRK